jgi:hypothetical protein
MDENILEVNPAILTPRFSDPIAAIQLPVFDASENEDRVQKTARRSGAKLRRQKPVVGFTKKNHPEGTKYTQARRQNPVVAGTETGACG